MFLKKKEKFISQLLKHIGTSALMDLLLRLVSCVEPVGLRQEVLHWLNEEKIIQRIVALIHPHQDEDVSAMLTEPTFLHGHTHPGSWKTCCCVKGASHSFPLKRTIRYFL